MRVGKRDMATKPAPTPVRSAEATKIQEYENMKRRIHNKLVDKLDLTRVGDLQGDTLRREIRIVVESDRVSDEATVWLSKDIARRIENELQYPGQIKVTVIRETRAVDYAR